MVKRTRRQRAAGKADIRSKEAKAMGEIAKGRAPVPSYSGAPNPQTMNGSSDTSLKTVQVNGWQISEYYDGKFYIYPLGDTRSFEEKTKGQDGFSTMNAAVAVAKTWEPSDAAKARALGKTAGRRRRSSSLSAMIGKPLKMLMGKKTRKNRRNTRRR